MPLGVEYSHEAGAIRAAAALVDIAGAQDEEPITFDLAGGDSMYYVTVIDGSTYYVVPEWYAERNPTDVEAATEAGSWYIFDEDPYLAEY